MKNRIRITADDMDRLRRLIDGRFVPSSRDSGYLEDLEYELDRAEVVPADRIPPNVVTMDSEVQLTDLDSGEEKVYKLVYPCQSRGIENAVSVLAPIGTALLGVRVGEVVKSQVPKGTRRLKVERLLFQPEAAARETRKIAS